MRNILIALMLAGCGDVSAIWNAHDYTWPEKLGTTEVIERGDQRFRVTYGTFQEVADSPCARYSRTDAAGCTLWISDPASLTPAAERVMAGYDAVIWVVPNEHLLEHELRHATCQCQFHL